MAVTYSQSVAAEIRSHMAYQGLKQRALAIRLGWTRQYLSRRLTGVVPWSTEDLAQLANALEIPVSELVSPRAAAG